MPQSILPFKYESRKVPKELRGAVYTKNWVVELLLDLAGYTPDRDLPGSLAIEPAAGEGAFLAPMAGRLLSSCLRQGRPPLDCAGSLVAYEIDEESAEAARVAVISSLTAAGIAEDVARTLASNWVRVGDYLFDSPRLPAADFVIGNPPYIRIEVIPNETMGLYRNAYPTMRGRADLYVAFFEAALLQLKRGGVCAFICADRWMLNQYGAELRRMVTSGYNVQTIVEMHNADAFDSDVSAYPAISVIRREKQGTAVVASASASLESASRKDLVAYLSPECNRRLSHSPAMALSSATIDEWFDGSDPWPCTSPKRLATLRHLEAAFPTLEGGSDARVGIGVATGCDGVFITKDKQLVEPSRLLPLAMASDTLIGTLKWSGNYLVNPWNDEGLVDLAEFPRLRDYFQENKTAIANRHTAKKNPGGWYRTIDRVATPLTLKPKLYIPDIKNAFNPVLDDGKTYPHHNLYYICSNDWDLEVLGGILLSAVGQFFIESYGVRMRGGYLRFQAQYLRRIRVPRPRDIAKSHAEKLKMAFRDRDRRSASEGAFEVYGIEPQVFDL